MAKSNGSSWSLKFKLIALSLTIVVFLGGASFGVINYIIKQQTTAALESFESYANGLSDAIAAQYFERYGDVQAFALNPNIQSNNRQTIIDTLNAYSGLYLIYDLIMVVDLRGRLVAVTDKDPSGKEINVKPLYEKNYADAEWFKAVVSGKTTDDKEKAFVGTYAETVQVDPYVSEVYGSSRLGSSFSAAVKDSKGNVIGVISNRAGARWFEVAFKESYAGLKNSGFPDAEVAMLAHDGTLLYEYNPNPTSEKLEESVYDFETLLKQNLAESGNEAAKELVAGKSGAISALNSRTKAKQFVGYARVHGAKFTDSLGWGVMVRDSEEEALEGLNRAKNIFYIIFSIVFALSILFSYLFSNGLAKTLMNLANRLAGRAGEVANASAQISNASHKLSEAATEQAAAIQETAASIDEVSAMVKKSADNAADSQKASESSREAAEAGQRAVEQMQDSIKQISQSNSAIVTQVEEGNREISEIVRVISEIENKTKVINDIVFQTKLLSFNASVEAARAGEHGKGFAVVAEEVGKLAEMSGTAAKEISGMLEQSISKVEGIVNTTKSRVDNLVREGKSSVDHGMQVAEKCGASLQEILKSVKSVDGMVAEIATASKEQAQGVTEINEAINQLDQVTHQNTAVSQQTAGFARELNEQSQDVKNMVDELLAVIHGSGTSAGVHVESEMAPVGNVSPLKKRTQKNTVEKVGAAKASSEPHDGVTAKAVGANQSETPSSNDPRFIDV